MWCFYIRKSCKSFLTLRVVLYKQPEFSCKLDKSFKLNPRLWHKPQRIRLLPGRCQGRISARRRVISKDKKMVPTAAMSGARHKYLELGECLGPKEAQLITMHSQDPSDKGRAIKGLVVYRSNGLFTPRSMIQGAWRGLGLGKGPH